MLIYYNIILEDIIKTVCINTKKIPVRFDKTVFSLAEIIK